MWWWNEHSNTRFRISTGIRISNQYSMFVKQCACVAQELFAEEMEASSSSEQSSVWNHFAKHKVAGQASCKYCNKRLKWNGSTTSNLWNHVKKFHGVAVPDQKPHGLVSARQRSPSLVRSNSVPLPSRKPEPRVTQITYFFKLVHAHMEDRPLSTNNDEGFGVCRGGLQSSVTYASGCHFTRRARICKGYFEEGSWEIWSFLDDYRLADKSSNRRICCVYLPFYQPWVEARLLPSVDKSYAWKPHCPKYYRSSAKC